MPHDLPLSARHAMTVLRAAVITVLLGLCLTQGSVSGGPLTAGRVVEQPSADETRMIARHDCSSTGFGPGVIPGSALVRGTDGQLRVVSFDRGWRIYTRRGAARLVAVCRHEPNHQPKHQPR